MFSKPLLLSSILATVITSLSLAAPPIRVDSGAAPTTTGVIDPRLQNAVGNVDVIIRLDDLPLAAAHVKNAKALNAWLTAAQSKQQLDKIKAKQDGLVAR